MTGSRSLVAGWRSNQCTTAVAAMLATIGINVAVIAALGMRVGGDTGRYVGGAERIISGQALTERQTAYIGYIWLLAVVQMLHLPIALVYAVHVLASGAAAWALARAGWRLAGAAGAVATSAGWVLLLDAHRWNAYLLTDGMFISLVAIAAALCFAADEDGPTPVLAGLAIAAMALVRINGAAYGAMLAAGLALRTRRRPARAAFAILAVAILIGPTTGAVKNLLAGSGSRFSHEVLLSDLTSGEIIRHTVAVQMPPAGPTHGNVASDLVAYIAAHPLAVARVYVLRLGHYVFGFNPTYSPHHLAAVVVQWLILYAGVAAGLLELNRRRRIVDAWPALIWMLQGAVVVATVGDFDGRYSLYAVGALLPLFGVGVARFISTPEIRAATEPGWR